MKKNGKRKSGKKKNGKRKSGKKKNGNLYFELFLLILVYPNVHRSKEKSGQIFS
ncbi:MAG: hypothetical protein QXL96_08405 [Ignisphaera sp.]